jgi:hypothetical protein
MTAIPMQKSVDLDPVLRHHIEVRVHRIDQQDHRNLASVKGLKRGDGLRLFSVIQYGEILLLQPPDRLP